jgi:hypothetical protein
MYLIECLALQHLFCVMKCSWRHGGTWKRFTAHILRTTGLDTDSVMKQRTKEKKTLALFGMLQILMLAFGLQTR